MNVKDTIGIYPGALSKNFCEKLIRIFEENPQYHYSGVTASGYNTEFKHTTDFNIAGYDEFRAETDWITRVANEKVSDYLNRFPTNENFNTHNYLFSNGTYYPVWQLQKYVKNEGHFNSYHTEGEYWEFYNRIFAVMFYLNDVEDGGETEFLHQEMMIKPTQGTFLVWPAPWPYVHKGHVPKSNNKYILTTWLNRNENIDE